MTLGASALGVGVIAAAGLALRDDNGRPTGAVSPASAATTSTRAPTTTTTVPSTTAVKVATLAQPTTAEATGASLAKVEAGLRGEDRDPSRLQALGREQQMAYRALSNTPEWVPTALAAVPAALRAAVQTNIDAGTALSRLTASTTAPTTLPDWKILVPPAADTLRTWYQEAERASSIPWYYLASIHFVESRIGRIHGNSSAGAQGPMQFLPSTWAEFSKGDIYDNHEAILAAARFLVARGGPANMDRALLAYNPDTRYVAAIKAYAQVMQGEPKAYDGYYQWQVFYATADGAYVLPDGYGTTPQAAGR
jgi:membrane-bound lytic murein transglycosylase B